MKTGSGSGFPIVRLASRFQQMTTDGRVLSNRAAIDIIDQRVIQLLERVDNDETPQRTKALYDEWQIFKDLDPADPMFMAQKMVLERLFQAAFTDYQAWKQIFEALSLRRQMSESEVKVLKEIKAIMTAEEGYELVAKLLGAVMKVNGDDPKKLKEIQYEFTRIIGESSDLVGKGSRQHVGGTGEGDRGEEGSDAVDQTELLHPGDQA